MTASARFEQTIKIHAMFFFSCCYSFHNLHVDLLKDCMQWNTISEQRNKWRLLNKNTNNAFNITHHQINQKIAKIMQFAQRMSDPQIFDNTSLINELSSTIKEIKLSPQFIANIPNLITAIDDQIQPPFNESSTNSTITINNILSLTNLVFGTGKYDTMFDNLTFSKLLVYASRKILHHAMGDRKSPELDAWKLLYGLIFEYYPQNLPKLADIPYLRDNLEIPGKFEHLTLIETLMDKCGFIVYSEQFIDAKWFYGDLRLYITEYEEVFSALDPRRGLNLVPDDDETRAFYFAFTFSFTWTFLQHPECDLSIITQDNGYGVLQLSVMIEKSVWYIYANDMMAMLSDFLNKLMRSNGLHLLKKANVIGIVIEQETEEWRIVDFLYAVISANLRYHLRPELLAIIVDLMYSWIEKGLNGLNSCSADIRTAATELVMDDSFHPDLINQLVEIHAMYDFVDVNLGHGQLIFFLRFITELMKLRNDWNYGDEVDVFLRNVDQTSKILRPMVAMMETRINASSCG